MRRLVAALGCAALCTSLLATSAFAAPKTGCPNGHGFTANPVSISAAADEIFPVLLDPSAFPGGTADLAADLAGYDRNGDGYVCLKWMWGDALNPNSHWYRVGMDILGSPTEQVLSYDNNSGAS